MVVVVVVSVTADSEQLSSWNPAASEDGSNFLCQSDFFYVLYCTNILESSLMTSSLPQISGSLSLHRFGFILVFGKIIFQLEQAMLAELAVDNPDHLS